MDNFDEICKIWCEFVRNVLLPTQIKEILEEITYDAQSNISRNRKNDYRKIAKILKYKESYTGDADIVKIARKAFTNYEHNNWLEEQKDLLDIIYKAGNTKSHNIARRNKSISAAMEDFIGSFDVNTGARDEYLAKIKNIEQIVKPNPDANKEEEENDVPQIKSDNIEKMKIAEPIEKTTNDSDEKKYERKEFAVNEKEIKEIKINKDKIISFLQEYGLNISSRKRDNNIGNTSKIAIDIANRLNVAVPYKFENMVWGTVKNKDFISDFWWICRSDRYIYVFELPKSEKFSVNDFKITNKTQKDIKDDNEPRGDIVLDMQDDSFTEVLGSKHGDFTKYLRAKLDFNDKKLFIYPVINSENSEDKDVTSDRLPQETFKRSDDIEPLKQQNNVIKYNFEKDDTVIVKKLDDDQDKAFNSIKNNPHKNYFIQGEAGTGKSYLINYIKQNLGRKYAVVAPSGIAAELIGGTTIHSLFHLGAHEFFPENTVKKYKGYDAVLSLIDTLIIDEASMLRADIFDTVDHLCREAKKDKLHVFGGIQIILVGDLRQLPPVYAYKKMHSEVNYDAVTYDDIDETDEQYEYIMKTYKQLCPYFFDAKCYKEAKFEVIQLKINHRQNDIALLSNLKKIGQGLDVENTLSYFNNAESFSDDIKDIPIVTAYKDKAKNINMERLRNLPGKTKEYPAIVSGRYYDIKYIKGENPEKILQNRKESHIVPDLLELKIGAKVMFCKNDTNERYVNGTMGTVKELKEKSVIVKVIGKETEVEVEQATWKKEEYKRINGTNMYELKEQGSFTQIPLKLAYAITIHKSQGQTWNSVCVDLEQQSAFADGQIYVALSRVKTKEGIHLTRPITNKDIKVNPRISAFLENPNIIPESDICSNEEINAKNDIENNTKLRQLLRNDGLRDVYKNNHYGRTELIEYLNNLYNLNISSICFTGISKGENNKYTNYVSTTMPSLDWWICLYDKDGESLRIYNVPPHEFNIYDFKQCNGKFCIEIDENFEMELKNGTKRNLGNYLKYTCYLKDDISSSVKEEEENKETFAIKTTLQSETDNNEINKLLKKYNISKIATTESIENQQIVKLEKENKKLKKEIQQFQAELHAIKQMQEERRHTTFGVRKEYVINGKQCSAEEFESRLRNSHYEVNVTLYYTNQSTKHYIWKVDNFTQKSSLSGNLHSGYLRGWREKGITAIRLELNT